MKKHDLFNNFINDSLSESEYKELLSRLENDETAEQFVEHIVETNMMICAAENIDNSQLPKTTSKKTILWPILTIAAALIFAFTLLSTPSVEFEVTSSSLNLFKSGQIISSSVISIPDGQVTLKMKNGTKVQVTGPAKLEVISSNQLDLKQGTVSVELASQVNSFEVMTPYATIEDLGTAFGIRLKQDKALLSVYDGLVRLKSAEYETTLQAGEAVSFSKTGYTKALYTSDVATENNAFLHSLGNRQLRPGQSMEFKLDSSAQIIKTNVSMDYDKDDDFSYKVIATANGKKIYESAPHNAQDSYDINIPIESQQNLKITLKALSGSIQNGLLKMNDVQLITEGYRPYEGNYLIPAQSEWAYKFKSLPKSGWMRNDFDAQHWLVGKASIGYGDYDLQTRIGPHSLKKTISKIYLRKEFELDNIELGDMKNLTLNLLADDGAMIYLNGRELLRHNILEGPITENTHALKRAGIKTGEIIYSNYTLPVDKLSQGANVITVILYQVKNKSSDMRFDLQLKVY